MSIFRNQIFEFRRWERLPQLKKPISYTKKLKLSAHAVFGIKESLNPELYSMGNFIQRKTEPRNTIQEYYLRIKLIPCINFIVPLREG